MSGAAHELLRKLLAQADRGGRTTLPITPRYARPYFDDDSLAAREAIHAVLLNAEQARGIHLEWGSGAASQDLQRIRIADADKLAAWLGVPRAIDHARIMSATLDSLVSDAPDWLKRAYTDSLQSWRLGKPALRIDHDDPKEAAILFRIALAVSRGEQENLDLRSFSVQLLGDSKAVENRLSRLAVLLRRKPDWTDFQDNTELFRAIGLEKFPPPMLLKGPLRIDYSRGVWDITQLRPFVGLSPDAARSFKLSGPAPYLLTIENLASFQRHVREVDDDGVVLFTAGFPAPALMQVLRKLDASLPHACPFFHWGDRDLGGLRVYAKVAEACVSHELEPHLMTVSADNCRRIPTEALKTLRKCSTAGGAAGALAKSWCENPEMGFLEQELQNPSPPVSFSHERPTSIDEPHRC